MSLLNQPLASPSRVRGLYRYLLAAEDQSVSREKIERLLSPVSIQKENHNDGFVKATINECKKMGLIQEQEGVISLHPDLSDAARSLTDGDELLFFTIATLIFDLQNTENHDLGRVLSWYLLQDVYDAPSNLKQAQENLQEKIGGDRFGMNDTVWGQLEDWSCFLGLSWYHSCNLSKVLTPDPTLLLRKCFSYVFKGCQEKTMNIRAILNKISELCPVFEGGFLRTEVSGIMGIEEKQVLSSTTSFALNRLVKEGKIAMLEKSDAEVFSLTGFAQRCSAIAWKGEVN